MAVVNYRHTHSRLPCVSSDVCDHTTAQNLGNNDYNLVVWNLADFQMPVKILEKYEGVLIQLRRSNRQNIAIIDRTSGPHLPEEIEDLFLDVFTTDDVETAIDSLLKKYQIRPERVVVVCSSAKPFKAVGCNILDINGVNNLLYKEDCAKISVNEPPEIARYREREFTSRNESLELLRVIAKKYDASWARHELVDTLIQTNDIRERLEAYRICKSFSENDVEMKYKLAVMYKMGIGTDKDVKRYMNELREAMLNGSEKARYEWIRNVIDNKISTEYENAVELCDVSDPQLRGYLARMYRHGYGVEKDLDEAISLMKSAAGDGVGWAKNELTDFLVARNEKNDAAVAFEICSGYAADGNAWAKGRLSRLYRDGVGVNKNINEAISLMRDAVAGGVPWAKPELEEMLKSECLLMIPKDISAALLDNTDHAFKEIERISREDSELAKRILIKIEELNSIVSNSKIEANLMRLRVKMGDDSDRALDNLIRLALTGNKAACRMLGRMYAEGDMVDKNIDYAITYTRLALARSTGLEINMLIDLLLERGTKDDLYEAYTLCLESSQEGDVWSTGRLGRMYKDGKGVKKDIDKAIEYLRIAQSGGVPWAKDDLKWLLKKRNTDNDVIELGRLV